MTLAAGLVITIMVLQQAYGHCESSYYRTGLGLAQTNKPWFILIHTNFYCTINACASTSLDSGSYLRLYRLCYTVKAWYMFFAVCTGVRRLIIHSRYHQLRFCFFRYSYTWFLRPTSHSSSPNLYEEVTWVAHPMKLAPGGCIPQPEVCYTVERSILVQSFKLPLSQYNISSFTDHLCSLTFRFSFPCLSRLLSTRHLTCRRIFKQQWWTKICHGCTARVDARTAA